jgi:ABC-type branched-subunit amino acid transport system substrate-binding protein
MKKLLLVFSLVFLGVVLVACNGDTTTTTTEATQSTTESTTVSETQDTGSTTTETTVSQTTETTQTTQSTDTNTDTTDVEEVSQGVTATTIKVGNTAAVTGGYAFVGVPFNDAIKAVFKQVNDAGGIDGRTIQFVSYDDNFNAELGVTYTETLVEDDEIFALVGHFGTPTVGATINYIQTTGIPMVYAATGINQLYFYETPGNPVMAVQPIYLTDGRIMTARAVKEAVYGPSEDQNLGASAVYGVLYTNDDVGNSIKAGVESEFEILDIPSANVVYLPVADGTYETQVQLLAAYGVSSVILAMNQGPFASTLTAMSNQSLNVPVFTSYVNADVSAVDHTQYHADRDIYTNAWVDVFSTEGQVAVQEYVATIMQADLDEATKTAYYGDSFAIAGYIAAKVFVAGLERVAANGDVLNWENYIAAMEESPIDIPMGGVVDFSGGKRWGIASMSLLKYTYGLGDDPSTPDVTETDFLTESFIKVREIQTIEEIEGN